MLRFGELTVIGLLLMSATATGQGWPPPCEIPPDRDNTLYEDPAGALSNGAGQHFFAGRTNQAEGSIRRGVVYFDIYNVLQPSPTEMFFGPHLKLHVSQFSGTPSEVSLHRLVNGWGEGISDAAGGEDPGAPSEAGDATWIHTNYSTEFWNQSGGDYVPTPSATLMIDGEGFFSFGSTPLMEADLRLWYCNADSNFGWIIIGDESQPGTLVRFDSRENPDSLFRPELNYNIMTCDCFYSTILGDLDFDHFRTALDLGILIDALFAGGPNPTECTAFLGDVDCNCFTDALDLSLMIDVLYAGAGIQCWWPCEHFDPCGGVCTWTGSAITGERVRIE